MPLKGELTMKRDQSKVTLNKRYQPKVDFRECQLKVDLKIKKPTEGESLSRNTMLKVDS